MASVTDVGASVLEALAARLKRDAGAISRTDRLRDDLGLDSLDMIELLFRIEEVFDLEIPNADLTGIATVGDVIAYVERRLALTGTAREKPGGRAARTAPVRRPAPVRKRAAATRAAAVTRAAAATRTARRAGRRRRT